MVVAAVVVVAVLSGWASGWQRYTWGARIGTFASAAAVLVLGAWWARARRPRDRTRTVGATGPGPGATTGRIRGWGWAWVGVVVVAGTWDVLALLTPPDRHHLTLSALELAERPFHALVFALWLLVGWVLATTPLRRRPRRRLRSPDRGQR